MRRPRGGINFRRVSLGARPEKSAAFRQKNLRSGGVGAPRYETCGWGNGLARFPRNNLRPLFRVRRSRRRRDLAESTSRERACAMFSRNLFLSFKRLRRSTRLLKRGEFRLAVHTRRRKRWAHSSSAKRGCCLSADPAATPVRKVIAFDVAAENSPATAVTRA